MPQADGTILIDTEINADGMKAGSKEVEAAVRRMASSVNNLGTKAKTALNKQLDAFSKLNNEFAAQSKKVDELKKKVSDYGKQKIPTDEYREIQNQISQASARMDRLIAQQERFLSMGGKTNSNQFKRYQYDIDELANTIRYAEGELRDLEESGKAFTFGSQTKQAAADMEKLAEAERKLSDMNNRLGTSYSSIKGQINDYKNNLLKADQAQKKTSASGNKIAKSLNNTAKAANKSSFGLGKMLGTSILFSFVFQAINGAMTVLTDGFSNLAQYSSSTNNSISMLWSSLERLKNSLATAFAPILDVVAPILSRFIDMISTAASYVSMFFAFLSGKSTYTRAVAVQKDYAASLQDTSSSAENLADSTQDTADATDEATEAADRYLSPLDDINKYSKESEKLSNPASPGSGSGSGSPGTGGGTGGEGPLFEEVPIDNKFASVLDSIIDKLKQIRDIFMDGFWDGLGDYKPLVEELKKDLSSIGSYLTDIFTDADVQAAAQRFAKSFIYNFGKIAGSLASVGLTIAVNIIGGIESFLAENVDRIKNYLVSMFDIGTEIMDTIGNLSATIAEIFSSVFGSQVAQDLTGDIIGIFANIFMGVTELAASLGRDLLNFIAQPIIENKDLIKNALLGTLQPLEIVIQSIETFIQDLVDKVLGLYNEHIKPFIDSLASGISQILGILLEGYNQYIVPVLDGLAQKFAELMAGPVGQAINSIIAFLGKLIDALKLLWESVLVPFFSWISENVMPLLAIILETVGNNVLSLFAVISNVVSGIFDILSGLIDFLVGVFTGNWELAFSGLSQIADVFKGAIESIIEGVKGFFSGLIDFVKSVFITAWESALEGIKTLAKLAFEFVKERIIVPIAEAKDNVVNILKNMKEGISDIFENIKTTVKNAFSWIKDKIITPITEAKNKAVNLLRDMKNSFFDILNGIKNRFSSVFESIVNVVKSPINGVIRMINSLLNKVETAQNWIAEVLSFSIDLPGWAQSLTGYSSFGISIARWSIPDLPYLASGAVIPPNREFMAVLGDQNQGNNIEAPESLIRRIVREEAGNNSGVYEFIAQINRKTIFKEVIEQGKLTRIQTGKNPFELG